MKNIVLQIREDYKYNGYIFVPHSLIDHDESKTFKPNQIVNSKIWGTKKERSYKQLKMYFGCCNVVAENTNDPVWCEKDKADFQCRVSLQFFKHDRIAVIGNRVAFEVESLNYDNCDHPKCCKYMDKAFLTLADKINVDEETLKQMYVEQSSK